MKVMHHSSEDISSYSNEYVEVKLELVDSNFFLHVEILKKDKDTRDIVKKTWLGLQEYLLSKGITEVYGLVEKDNTKLKTFIESYGVKKDMDCTDGYEIWIAELR